MASTPLQRRLLNQAFFKRILIGEDSQVIGTTLTPVYAALGAWRGCPVRRGSWWRRFRCDGYTVTGMRVFSLLAV